MMKVSAHPATDDFGVPEVNCSWERDGSYSTESGRRPHDGSDVARILDGIEDEQYSIPVIAEVIERALGHHPDGNNSLGRFGFSGGAKLICRHILDVDVAGPQGGRERHAARRFQELWRHQRASDEEWRPQQFFHGTHALSDEEPVLISRFAALQIARQSQKFHV